MGSTDDDDEDAPNQNEQTTNWVRQQGRSETDSSPRPVCGVCHEFDTDCPGDGQVRLFRSPPVCSECLHDECNCECCCDSAFWIGVVGGRKKRRTNIGRPLCSGCFGEYQICGGSCNSSLAVVCTNCGEIPTTCQCCPKMRPVARHVSWGPIWECSNETIDENYARGTEKSSSDDNSRTSTTTPRYVERDGGNVRMTLGTSLVPSRQAPAFVKEKMRWSLSDLIRVK